MIEITADDFVQVKCNNVSSLIKHEPFYCASYTFHQDTVVCIVDVLTVQGGWITRKVLQATTKGAILAWMRHLGENYEVVGFKFVSDIDFDTEIPEKQHRPNFVDCGDSND